MYKYFNKCPLDFTMQVFILQREDKYVIMVNLQTPLKGQSDTTQNLKPKSEILGQSKLTLNIHDKDPQGNIWVC